MILQYLTLLTSPNNAIFSDSWGNSNVTLNIIKSTFTSVEDPDNKIGTEIGVNNIASRGHFNITDSTLTGPYGRVTLSIYDGGTQEMNLLNSALIIPIENTQCGSGCEVYTWHSNADGMVYNEPTPEATTLNYNISNSNVDIAGVLDNTIRFDSRNLGVTNLNISNLSTVKYTTGVQSNALFVINDPKSCGINATVMKVSSTDSTFGASVAEATTNILVDNSTLSSNFDNFVKFNLIGDTLNLTLSNNGKYEGPSLGVVNDNQLELTNNMIINIGSAAGVAPVAPGYLVPNKSSN